MPKQSFAQEVADLESLLAALRSHPAISRPLVQTAADELEAQIAEMKELKHRQQAYLAEQIATTAAMKTGIADGTRLAREIRSYVILAFGAKNARITGFGLRMRRRPRRKAQPASPAIPEPLADVPIEIEAAGGRSEIAAPPLGRDAEASDAARKQRRMARPARADDAGNRASARANWGDAGRNGGDGSELGETDFGIWGTAQPIWAVPARQGGTASDNRGDAADLGANVAELRGDAASNRGTVLADRGARIPVA